MWPGHVLRLDWLEELSSAQRDSARLGLARVAREQANAFDFFSLPLALYVCVSLCVCACVCLTFFVHICFISCCSIHFARLFLLMFVLTFVLSTPTG